MSVCWRQQPYCQYPCWQQLTAGREGARPPAPDNPSTSVEPPPHLSWRSCRNNSVLSHLSLQEHLCFTLWQQQQQQSLPQTSRGVLEDGGPISAVHFGGIGRVSPPARVWDDDFVGQSLKALVDDHHLQWLVWGEVPQSACRGTKILKL